MDRNSNWENKVGHKNRKKIDRLWNWEKMDKTEKIVETYWTNRKWKEKTFVKSNAVENLWFICEVLKGWVKPFESHRSFGHLKKEQFSLKARECKAIFFNELELGHCSLLRVRHRTAAHALTRGRTQSHTGARGRPLTRDPVLTKQAKGKRERRKKTVSRLDSAASSLRLRS